MKPKPRRILVDSRAFMWRVSRETPTTVRLRIWADGRKSPPWADVICPFDDVWLNVCDIVAGRSGEESPALQPLVPRQVAKIVRLAIPLVERPGDSRSPEVFHLGADGRLISS